MAKTMAKVENGIVTNVVWCADNEPQTETLINISDRPAGIGDTYDGADFYRDGAKVLTPLEEALAKIAALEADNADKTAALEVLGVAE